MRENKSPLTVPQSLKLYTGNGILLFAAQLVWLEMLFFIASSAVLILMIMLGEGMSYAEAAESLADVPVIDILMALSVSFMNCLMLNTQYKKGFPGGKLFRTVKGGFDTFAGYIKGAYIAVLIASAADCCVFLLLDTTGLVKLHGGISAVIAAVVSMTVALSVAALALMSEYVGIRVLVSVLMPAGIVTAGALLLPALDMGYIPHIITGVAGTVFMVISAKAYLSYYKKNLWNN